jgi:hypothetical protein
VDPVPDPLPLRKSGRAGNRTQDLWLFRKKGNWRTRDITGTRNKWVSLALKMESVYSSETSENLYRIIRRHIPRGSTLQGFSMLRTMQGVCSYFQSTCYYGLGGKRAISIGIGIDAAIFNIGAS